MESWYCVRTKPREERRALAHITAAGLRAWLPEINVTKRRHGRPTPLTEPLFPSYLFVVMDLAVPAQWQAVRWGRGVRDVVRHGADVLPVPETAMTALLARFGRGITQNLSFLAAGTRVRVMRGPMVHLEGLLVESPTPQQRVRVLMQLLHRELVIELDALDLERVS
jgi:transcriptional antiterminator RfaH